MTWATLRIHCPYCQKVRRPRLTAGTSLATLTATCPECQRVIKQVDKVQAEPAPVAGEASSGPQLYDTRDLPRMALRELARRKLLALGIRVDAPRPDKHTGE